MRVGGRVVELHGPNAGMEVRPTVARPLKIHALPAITHPAYGRSGKRRIGGSVADGVVEVRDAVSRAGRRDVNGRGVTRARIGNIEPSGGRRRTQNRTR